MLVIECLALNKQLSLARQFFQESNFDDAKNTYGQILTDYPECETRTDILYNLALCHIALENIDEALGFLQKVLDLKPNHANALNNLGALLLKQNKPQEALQCFSAVIIVEPEHPEARHNLAALLLQEGRFENAAEQFEALVKQFPEDIRNQYHYATALLEAGKLHQAVTVFEKIVQKDPDFIDAKTNLAISYLKLGNTISAEKLFQEVLEAKPDFPEIQFLYQALSQKALPEKPPKKYIQHLFNQYAHYYDAHMLQALHYQAPKQLFSLLKKHANLSHTFHILDLGCGTGLSGAVFKPIAKSLTGIDLSEKMLALAEKKKIYTELLCQDLSDYLSYQALHHPHLIDLIISADTFNYFGDLQPLFKHCSLLLKPDGYLLFSAELLKQPASDNPPNWHLQPCARYAHSTNYLHGLAAKNGFKIIESQSIMLREQNHQPVEGFIALFQIISEK